MLIIFFTLSVRSQEFIYLVTESLYPLTSKAPFPQLVATTTALLLPWALLSKSPRTGDVIQRLSFSVWPSSRSMMFLTFISAVANWGVPHFSSHIYVPYFHMPISYFHICQYGIYVGHIFFVYISIGGHQVIFHILTIVPDVARNMNNDSLFNVVISFLLDI